MKDTIGLNFNGCMSEIIQFPRCGPIAVFGHVHLSKELRGKGIGRKAHAERLQKAQEAGYDYAVCTVNHDNIVERRILALFRWGELAVFTASNGHRIILFGRDLKKTKSYLPTEHEMAAYERWEKSLERPD